MLATYLFADRQTVHARQHPVEDHEVRTDTVGGGERLVAVEGLIDRISVLLQVRADEAGQSNLVLDYENPGQLRLRATEADPERAAKSWLRCG